MDLRNGYLWVCRPFFEAAVDLREIFKVVEVGCRALNTHEVPAVDALVAASATWAFG